MKISKISKYALGGVVVSSFAIGVPLSMSMATVYENVTQWGNSAATVFEDEKSHDVLLAQINGENQSQNQNKREIDKTTLRKSLKMNIQLCRGGKF